MHREYRTGLMSNADFIKILPPSSTSKGSESSCVSTLICFEKVYKGHFLYLVSIYLSQLILRRNSWSTDLLYQWLTYKVLAKEHNIIWRFSEQTNILKKLNCFEDKWRLFLFLSSNFKMQTFDKKTKIIFPRPPYFFTLLDVLKDII
jgi:hypothetical protein